MVSGASTLTGHGRVRLVLRYRLRLAFVRPSRPERLIRELDSSSKPPWPGGRNRGRFSPATTGSDAKGQHEPKYDGRENGRAEMKSRLGEAVILLKRLPSDMRNLFICVPRWERALSSSALNCT
jgi:hypothetical protein